MKTIASSAKRRVNSRPPAARCSLRKDGFRPGWFGQLGLGVGFLLKDFDDRAEVEFTETADAYQIKVIVGQEPR